MFSSLVKKSHTVALEIKTSDLLCFRAGLPFTFILRLNKTFGVKVEFNKRTTWSNYINLIPSQRLSKVSIIEFKHNYKKIQYQE